MLGSSMLGFSKSRTVKSPIVGLVGLVVLLILALISPRLAFAADPFYERLLQKGKRALATDVREAEEDLRLACFGLLEEPPVLADCLVHLAVAQGLGGNDAAFRETFTRIHELELRFEIYADLELSPSVRETFEGRLETLAAYESLTNLAAFRPIAQRVLEDELASLSGNDRRRRLEALRQEEPGEIRWLIMMSEVELEDGNFNDALEMATLTLRRDTELLRAICVRGRAQAALGKCGEALGDLMSCDRDSPERNREVTLARIRCLITQKAWDDAETLLDQLEREGLGNAESRGLTRDVRRGRRQKPSSPTPADPPSTESPPDGTLAPTGDPVAGPNPVP